MVYEEVVEVQERLVLQQDSCGIRRQCPCTTAVTGEQVEVWQTVDKEKLRRDLQAVLDKGIRSLAVVLLHSYM